MTPPTSKTAAITEFGGQPLTAVSTDQAAHYAWSDMRRYKAKRYCEKSVVIGYDLLVEPHPNTLVDPQGTLTPQQYNDQNCDTLYDWNRFAPRDDRGDPRTDEAG